MAVPRLLLSGDRGTFTVLELNLDKNELRILDDYPAPYNASWVEHCSTRDGISTFVGLSEEDEEGSLYTFEIDGTKKTCVITSQQPTLGAPAHCEICKTTMERGGLSC